MPIFKFDPIPTQFRGAEAYAIAFETFAVPCKNDPPNRWTSIGGRRRAFGRAVRFDPSEVELRIYPFYELIHRSWIPGTHHYVREGPNLGTSVWEFIYDQGGPELKQLGRLSKTRADRVRKELGRVFFACNGPNAGYVRSNCFVVTRDPGTDPLPGESVPPTEAIAKPQLIAKPKGAGGLDDRLYVPLGPVQRQREGKLVSFSGRYDVFVFKPQPRIDRLPVNDNQCAGPLPELAICSPVILENGNAKAPADLAYCPKGLDQTVENEVNWDPETTCTSFTGFGATEDRKIVVVSMFESIRGGEPTRNRGITASEIGWLMSESPLDAVEGVIGGGSADTQQFLDADCKGMPALLEAPPRFKRPEEVSTEVLGPRGLGAIFAVFPK